MQAVIDSSVIGHNSFNNNLVFRFVSIAPLATLFTLALVAFMQHLIANKVVVIDTEPRHKISSILLDIPEPIPVIDNRIEPPDPVERAPQMDVDLFPTNEFGTQVVIGPQIPVEQDVGKMNIDFSSGSLVSLNRVQPNYPQRAITKGIEGFVDVQFDISVDGIPHNIQVVAAEPRGYFESAAESAVRRWKFQVPKVDGQAQPVKARVERIRFTLSEN